MGAFGVAVMVGPVAGPVVGGWLTDNFNWRWIFCINLPLGALAFAGISLVLYETKSSKPQKFDWLGFGSLSIFLGALQIFLDRGSQLDWFSSLEILLEAVVAASAFYIFIVHIFTAKNAFANPELFLDRNYAVGVTFIFIIGISYLASMALMTPYLQSLMGYPIVTQGVSGDDHRLHQRLQVLDARGHHCDAAGAAAEEGFARGQRKRAARGT